MSDFLATLAAQALSAAPVAHPLVPARYAPMPPIGGVGTLEGLRAGRGMAASAPEGPPPSLDRVDVPPPLMETGAYHTAYYPFSYLQLQQAGGYQAVAVEPGIEPPALLTDGEAVNDVTSTEPAPGADAGRSTVVASSAPAGEPAYPMRDATGPPSQIAEPLVATQPPVQQAVATAPSRVSPTPPAAEVVASPPTTGAPQTDLAGQSTHGDTSVHVPSTPRAASVTPAAAEQPASVAVEPNATVLSTPPAPATKPAMTEQPALAASTMPPATERSAPAPDSVVFPRREGAAPAFLAKPIPDADTLPHPAPAGAAQASAAPDDQLRALQTQPPAEATPLAPRSEVVAPSPVVRSLQMDLTGQPASDDAMAQPPVHPQ